MLKKDKKERKLAMDYQYEYQNQQQPKKDHRFGKGVLLGVVCTLAVLFFIALTGVLLVRAGKIMIGKTTAISQENRTEKGNAPDENTLNAEFLGEVAMIDSYLDQYFIYDVDKEALRDGMLEGMVDALNDPYSEYYNEAALQSFKDSTDGSYFGIGAAVTQELATGIVRIAKPYAGTPSAEAGLLPGDMIVRVDDTEVTGMELNQVVTLIKGPEGTDVVLHIYRESENQEMDVTVTRAKVELPTVSSRVLENNIGYIEVTSFDGVTGGQFKAAFEEIKEQKVDGLVIDMRNNGGGLVDTVEEMLDYLLPEGVIFYAKDKNGEKTMLYESDASAALDLPLVVLVNQNTASAAEIFSGNIQAFGMGTIVGTTTYGKGVMQQLFYTNNEKTSAVKLTVADYYINGDKNVNGTGITPDVEIELDEEAATKLVLEDEEDNQLQKALEILGEQIRQ